MFIKDKKGPTILCPHCKYEYLPAEIFIPNSFFGKPESIERNDMGAIDVYEGTAMCLDEEYTCDNCGKQFTVTADVRFKTKEKEAFNPVYSSPLFQRISLFEGEGEQGDN